MAKIDTALIQLQKEIDTLKEVVADSIQKVGILSDNIGNVYESLNIFIIATLSVLGLLTVLLVVAGIIFQRRNEKESSHLSDEVERKVMGKIQNSLSNIQSTISSVDSTRGQQIISLNNDFSELRRSVANKIELEEVKKEIGRLKIRDSVQKYLIAKLSVVAYKKPQEHDVGISILNWIDQSIEIGVEFIDEPFSALEEHIRSKPNYLKLYGAFSGAYLREIKDSFIQRLKSIASANFENEVVKGRMLGIEILLKEIGITESLLDQ